MPLADASKKIERLRSHILKAEEALLKDSRWHQRYGKSMWYFRDKIGLSLRHVADKSGISLAKLHRLEKGEASWTVKDAEKYLQSLCQD